MPITSQKDIDAAVAKARAANISTDDILNDPDIAPSIKDYIRKTQGRPQMQQPSWTDWALREGAMASGNFFGGLSGDVQALGAPSANELASHFPQPAGPGERIWAAGARSAGEMSPSLLYPPFGIPLTAGAFAGGAFQQGIRELSPFKSDTANELLGIGGAALLGGGVGGWAKQAAGYVPQVAQAAGQTATRTGAAMKAAGHGLIATTAAELSEVALRHFGGLPPFLAQMLSIPIGVGASVLGKGGATPFSGVGALGGGGAALLNTNPPPLPPTPNQTP